MTNETPDFILEVEKDMAQEAEDDWIQKAAQQIGLEAVALDAIDRSIGIGEGDILVCESTLLDYAEHALSNIKGIRELWVVPPQLSVFAEFTDKLFDEFKSKFVASSKRQLKALEAHGAAFKGLTTSTPERPFKLLITDAHCNEFIPFGSQIEWTVGSSLWKKMLGTKGSTGAVIYPLVQEKSPSSEENGQAVPIRYAEGAY